MTIDEVYSIGEASEMWGVNRSTLKFACTGQKGNPPRFSKDECRKSGSVWLISYEGMKRLYGEPIKEK